MDVDEIVLAINSLLHHGTFTVVILLVIAFCIKWGFISWIIKVSVKEAIKEAWDEQIRANRYEDDHDS